MTELLQCLAPYLPAASASLTAKKQMELLLAMITRTAVISPCGNFRYVLGRRWSAGRTLLFVMLNPSTADHAIDDRTINRCIWFAASHGYAGFEVVNLFAFRTAYPKELKAAGYPVGPENDSHIAEAVTKTDNVCLAWGSAGAETRRPAEVQLLLRSLGVKPLHLRVTSSGHPEHPLRLPGALRMTPFTVQAIDDAMHGSRACA